LIIEASKPYPVVSGWRVDAEEGKHEMVIYTGWESVEAHSTFTAQQREVDEQFRAMTDCYEGFEVKHGRNMESEAM